ncbi:hypothetical protein PMF13cell1_00767 [Blautia producta]|uniref:Uncharacterized protein n=2 Tax=Blautia producta TaxID=33035 RepID=A0A4P6LTP6_9FIRM|nr:hypothetical protein PMF13cell1_00767 [Blautia producta]
MLQPGQLITGRLKIAADLSVNESKVKRILNAFKTDQQIDQQASNKNSLITILNWESYQKSDQQTDQQMTSERPASDQQVTTNKNEKNVKNEKYKTFSPPTADEVTAYCQEMGYKVNPDAFVDFYDSKGWMVGKNKMKDWKAAVRNWNRSQRQESTAKGKATKFSNFQGRKYDIDSLESGLLRANAVRRT